MAKSSKILLPNTILYHDMSDKMFYKSRFVFPYIAVIVLLLFRQDDTASSWSKLSSTESPTTYGRAMTSLMSPGSSPWCLTTMARNAYAKWIDINGVPFIISSSVLIGIYSSILIQSENLKRKLGHAMKGQSFSEAMNLWK